MFKINRNYDEKSYKKFLECLLVDKKIKDEIIEQINIFVGNGKINFDGNNLYGKIIDKNGNDYLEIRYENLHFICNYTEWNGKNIVNITQINLKNGNAKIDRKEKTEYICPDDKNETKIKELEMIYNSENELIYDSTLNKSISYNTLENWIVYTNDSFLLNGFQLEKNWYISNGSIINYKLSKYYLDKQSEIMEDYYICPRKYSGIYGSCYNFEKLDENLFKSFMKGKITIHQLLEQHYEKQNNKNKRKKMQ